MIRNRQHLVVIKPGQAEIFRHKGGGGGKRPSDVADRRAHAEALLDGLDQIGQGNDVSSIGRYIEITGRPGEPLATGSLNSSGLSLLKFTAESAVEQGPCSATIFSTPDGIMNLRGKISAFADETQQTKSGRPKHADLVQSIANIAIAGLRDLWRSPENRFPANEGCDVPWEFWLDSNSAEQFLVQATASGVSFENERLVFPEVIVVIGYATHQLLADVVRKLGTVKALAAPTIPSDFFLHNEISIEEQSEWVQALGALTTQPSIMNHQYVSLLDRGIALNHPLIQPFLSQEDRHAADPQWSEEDNHGHGTQLAGLSLYGDLQIALQGSQPLEIGHRLESAKIMPDAGANSHHLLGAVVRQAVDILEQHAERHRTFAMACTTDEDSPHDGAPTSWSSEMDQLSSGTSGMNRQKRLFVISAGNTDQNRFQDNDYLRICDHPDHEIESPSQAWNAISVGAYTTKTRLPNNEGGQPVAPVGDLSPCSRTASWSQHWPIKPDVVMEGGNWVQDHMPPPMKHADLSLLTTDHRYPQQVFATTSDTSAATALVAKAIAEIRQDYPELWPETIRALFVSSARWTDQMRSHLPQVTTPPKGSYDVLFRRYGYGVPDVARARRSAGNAFSMIIEDTIIPYRSSETKGSEPINNEMKIYQLPWPKEKLRGLKTNAIRLRVTLSTFIEPNPSEAARGSKYRYASHNLRFKLNRSNETENQFRARISKTDNEAEVSSLSEDDGWIFGSNRRDVGSLHIDEFTCHASDLARRNILAVHPVAGWWKSKYVAEPERRTARFALVVELDAGTNTIDLYTEVENVLNNYNRNPLQN